MSDTAAQPDAVPRDSAALAWLCRLVIVVSTALSIARLMQAEPLQSANDRSRWCTVRALVEQGTYRIDDARRVPGWDTIDLVKHKDHFYSTKPPLLATLVAGLYRGIRQTLGWTLGNDLAATTRLILCLINVFPMTIALTLLLRTVRRLSLPTPAGGFATPGATAGSSSSAFAVILTALTAGFGTLLLPFVTTFNNHTPAAVSVVFALYGVLQIVAEQRRSGWWFAATGFWAAFAFTCELPAAAFLAAIAGWLALVSFRRTLLWFVPAALVPLAAFFATNFLVTGGLMPFYSSYGSEKYEFVHEGVPSYWMHPRGIDKNIDSFPVYLLHCVIGHHGLLSLSPIFVLTLLGWARAMRDFTIRVRTHQPLTTTLAGFAPIHALGASLTLVTLAFYLTRTANYNYGGVSVALRWMLWLVPFWLLAMPAAFEQWEPGKTARSLIGSALAVSVFSAWHPFDGPWKHPWLFGVMERVGWIDYSDPPVQLEHRMSTWINRVPTSPQRDVDYWIELTGRTPDNRRISVWIADGGPERRDEENLRYIEVTESVDGNSTLSRYLVHPDAMLAAAAPSSFIVHPDPVSDRILAAESQFWTGLPDSGDRVAEFRAIAVRYLPVPPRFEATRCIQAYAQNAAMDEAIPETTIHRCDVWISDSLPFGVAQVEFQIQDQSRTIISRQRLTVTRAGKAVSP